jgi:hypothetical protein
MAVENRGGMRPTAPQNNPNNISLTGGDGQNPRKPELEYRGLGYRTTGQTNAQAKAAPIKAKPATGGANMLMARGPAPVPLNAETQNPDETIFSGSSMPGGLDPSDLNLPAQPVGDPDLDSVIALYPVMRYWANQPDTPNATKEYVRYLGTLISKGPNRPV